MSSLVISAQFAAYVWFTGQPSNRGKSRAEAIRFAREQWEDFLPLAHKGLGRLLLRMMDLPVHKVPKRQRARKLYLGACAGTAHGATTPGAAGAGQTPFSCN